MERFNDWEIRFQEFIQQRQRMKFSWGKHDCLSFACDGVGALTGHDLMADWRGKYEDARGAYSLLRAVANGSMAKALQEKLGEPYPYPLNAKRGDIVVAHIRKPGGLNITRETAGLVDDSGWHALFPGLEHLIRLPLDKSMKAWRV